MRSQFKAHRLPGLCCAQLDTKSLQRATIALTSPSTANASTFIMASKIKGLLIRRAQVPTRGPGNKLDDEIIFLGCVMV